MAIIQHQYERPIPEWLLKALPKWLAPHWMWIYIDIKDDNNCWEWTGAARVEGYGRIAIKRKTILTHRLAYALQNKLTMTELNKTELIVRHTCDNPPCCNPKHLVLGTMGDNARDRKERGRYSGCRGEDNGCSVLTEDQVRIIKRYKNEGHWRRGDGFILADRFGVGIAAIYAITQNRNWKHIK